MGKRDEAAAARVASEILDRRQSNDPDEAFAIGSAVCSESTIVDRAIQIVDAKDQAANR